MGAISKHVNKQSLVVFLQRHCPEEVTNAEEWLQQFTGDQIVADALENFGEAPGYTTVQNNIGGMTSLNLASNCLGVEGAKSIAAILPKCT
jgi:hypothetical protein